jgi:hypothetical protein
VWGYAAELLAPLDIDHGVDGCRRGPDLIDGAIRRQALLAEVAVEHAGDRSPDEAKQRHSLLGGGHVARSPAGYHKDERRIRP